MKIVYFFPDLIQCGPANQSYYLLKGLVDKSIDVYLFSFYKSTKNEIEIERFKRAGIKVILFKFNLLSFIKARLELQSIKPDLIHSTTLVADIISFILGYGYKRFLTHRTDPFDHISSRGKIFGRLLFYSSKLISNNAYKSVACSNAIFERLNKNNIKVDSVIQNCVSKSFYQSKLNNYPLCTIPKLEINRTLNVISIGSLSERKNPVFTYLLLLHFAKSYSIHINLTYLGNGPLFIKMTEFLPSEFISVHLPGQVADVKSYFNDAHIHFSSSIAEGLPNSVLETLSCGIFNVLSDIPEHREFLPSANKMIFLFSLSDSFDQICVNLKAYIDSLDKINVESLNKFRNDFSETNMSDSYISIYKS